MGRQWREIDRGLYGQPLSPSEERVLVLLSTGLYRQDIEGKIRLSTNAMSNHYRRIMGKLGAATIHQAIYLWALEQPRTIRVSRSGRRER